MPNNESILSNKDPFQHAVIGGHKRINSASLDFFLSNPEPGAATKKESVKEEEEKKDVEEEEEK